MEQFEHLEETQLSSEAKYDGTLLHIRRDTVRLPDGKTATREYNIHNGVYHSAAGERRGAAGAAVSLSAARGDH